MMINDDIVRFMKSQPNLTVWSCNRLRELKYLIHFTLWDNEQVKVPQTWVSFSVRCFQVLGVRVDGN